MIKPSCLVELAKEQQFGRREHTAEENLCYSEPAEYMMGWLRMEGGLWIRTS